MTLLIEVMYNPIYNWIGKGPYFFRTPKLNLMATNMTFFSQKTPRKLQVFETKRLRKCHSRGIEMRATGQISGQIWTVGYRLVGVFRRFFPVNISTNMSWILKDYNGLYTTRSLTAKAPANMVGSKDPASYWASVTFQGLLLLDFVRLRGRILWNKKRLIFQSHLFWGASS